MPVICRNFSTISPGVHLAADGYLHKKYDWQNQHLIE